jgi:thiamine biosynthesis protein ThiS
MDKNQAIPIFVNGEGFQVPAGSNITGLLEFLEIAPDRVAVELNKVLIRKRDWEGTSVTSGAQLEVVEFVGGG